MTTYILRRLLIMIPLLLGISLISFFIMYLSPGGPTAILLDPKVPPAVAEQIKHNLGLDQPIPVQYGKWLLRAVQGDFGNSFVDGQPVLGKIFERIPNTLILMSFAFVLSLLLGIVLGVFSAVRPGSFFDRMVTLLTFAGFSIPSFWLGLVLIYLFGVTLGWFPTGGRGTLEEGTFFSHLVLPTVVLAVGSTAVFARYVRASTLEALQQDYIRTARAKGLTENQILFRHAFRNGLLPLITLLGLSLPDLFGGAYITETIFAWPGMGRLGVDAIFSRDYPVVMGIVMLSAVLIIVGNLLADVAYAYADPRVRYK